MKKIIAFIFVLGLFACEKDSKTTEQTIISGTVTGATDGKISITGNAFEKEITLNQDGTFTDTLSLPYSGTYQIQGANQSIYLEPNQTLNFVLDIENPDAITFTGDLAAENGYIVKKRAIRKEVLGTKRQDLYALDEKLYLDKVNDVTKKSTDLLNASTFKSKNFKNLETKNIDYGKASLLQTYSVYHGYVTENESFVVSDSFPKVDANINYDNAEDYNFSSAYRDLVQFNFDESVQDEVEKGGKNEDVLISKLKTIKSENIKNDLVEKSSYYVSLSSENLDGMYNAFLSLSTDETFKKDLTEKYNKLKLVTKGKPSPKFNYENHKGGTTSLDDLKGKYVYVDVWATWCGPCIAEIPALKEVEKKYHGKNIEFVSISVDDKKDYDKWKKFVTDKQLVGTQLYADNSWQSQFVKDYVIEGIPRFILIGPDGNIISGDAPRPSDEALIKLFDELKI